MTFHIEWPQAIYILGTLLGLIEVVIKHGKPRDNYNAWHTTLASLLVIALLYWGGFFS